RRGAGASGGAGDGWGGGRAGPGRAPPPARPGGRVGALAGATAALEESLPARVQDAVRGEAQPVGRNLAEIRGLMNQLLRRLSALECDLLTERNARVDDLALLVDLVSSGWQGVDARLGRLEAGVHRLRRQTQGRGGSR